MLWHQKEYPLANVTHRVTAQFRHLGLSERSFNFTVPCSKLSFSDAV